MDLGFKGKGVLVTGGSRGIGKEIAQAFAREGALVAICARSRDQLERAAAEIRSSTGTSVVPIVADMSSAADIERFVEQAAHALGRIDILVCNAGAAQPGFVLELPDEAFVDAINVKLLGYIRCARAVVPYMRRQGGGCIVVIAGGAGREPNVNMATAGIVNAGVINFTKALADALGSDNIRVVAVSPGFVWTERARLVQEAVAQQRGLTAEEVARHMTAGIPLRRFGKTSEVAAAVLFLASDHASYITGTTIVVDGGLCRAAI